MAAVQLGPAFIRPARSVLGSVWGGSRQNINCCFCPPLPNFCHVPLPQPKTLARDHHLQHLGAETQPTLGGGFEHSRNKTLSQARVQAHVACVCQSYACMTPPVRSCKYQLKWHLAVQPPPPHAGRWAAHGQMRGSGRVTGWPLTVTRSPGLNSQFRSTMRPSTCTSRVRRGGREWLRRVGGLLRRWEPMGFPGSNFLRCLKNP